MCGYSLGMKKTLASLILIAPLMLTACGGGNSQPADESTEALAVPEFRTTTEAGVDVSDQLPPDTAWACDSRPIPTVEGDETLKNFNLDGNKAIFYFAPKSHSTFNSYSYRLDFENGIMTMEDKAAGSFESFVQVYPNKEKEETFTALGSNSLTASFEVPNDFSEQLGRLKAASASINGQLAGHCSPEK